MSADYQSLIQQFKRQKIIVIGDLMLDIYLVGTSDRISREAPVPIVNVLKRELMPGGAANTALNLAALGAQTSFLSVTGHDHHARSVVRLLRQAGVDTQGIILDPMRETICKQRVLSDGQLLVRFDCGTTEAPSSQAESRILERLIGLYPDADAVLISDYGYGTVTPHVIAALRALQKKHHKLLIVDSAHLPRFRDLRPTAVKPNYQEAVSLLELRPEPKGRRVEQILAHGRRILDETGASLVAVTVDSEGAVILERGKDPYRTYARPVADSRAAGAGDTYVSALAIALSLGAAPLDAAELAAAASGIVVRKHGTAVCSAEELSACFLPPRKIITDREELEARVRAYHEQGRKIVFTNGCFDIVHRGHIAYLAQAKELGHLLIVGVNTDEGVRRLKGPERPINPLEDRMVVLAALDAVDHVVSFGENTPVELIKIIRPDVFVKGGDYTRATLPEASVVEALGGVVEILPYIEDHSTTAVIRKARAVGQMA